MDAGAAFDVCRSDLPIAAQSVPLIALVSAEDTTSLSCKRKPAGENGLIRSRSEAAIAAENDGAGLCKQGTIDLPTFAEAMCGRRFTATNAAKSSIPKQLLFSCPRGAFSVPSTR